MTKRNIIILGLLVLIVGVLAFFWSARLQQATVLPPSLTDTTPPKSTGLPSFTYKDLQPGTTTEAQAIISLGQPIRKEQEVDGTTMVYPSSAGTRPLLVRTDQQGIVSLIKEPLPEDTSFVRFSQQLGTHDMVLYGAFYPLGYELRVYLDEGAALEVNPTENVVSERWYFPANTDAAAFQRVFAPEFQTSPPPEEQE